MKMLKYLVFIFLIGSLNANLQAQEQQAQSIDNQFKEILKVSNDYTNSKGQTYKVIRRTLMLGLKRNTLDSLNAIQTKLDNTINNVNIQQKEINTLKTNLAKTEGTLATTDKEKDSMVLLGMQMSKVGYNSLMWSIIAALLGFLLFFIFMFKNSNLAANAAKTARTELEEEFKEHRRIALEREQKVGRQLQDELNKNRG